MENRNLGAVTMASLVMAMGAAPASAAEMISMPLSELLSNGSVYEGVFDLSSFLNPASGPAMQVSAARLTAFGYSDSQQSQTAGYMTSTQIGSYTRWVAGGTYSYRCGWSTCYQTYYYPVTDRTYNETTITAYSDIVADMMSLSSGEGSGSDIVGSNGSATSYVPAGFTQTGSNSMGYVTTYRYNQTTSGGGYYGELLAIADLTANDLALVNGDGLLRFTVGAPVGQFNLSNVSLSFEMMAVPAGGIPEPATWAMMIAGFGMAGAALRRRRDSEAAAA